MTQKYLKTILKTILQKAKNQIASTKQADTLISHAVLVNMQVQEIIFEAVNRKKLAHECRSRKIPHCQEIVEE